MSGPVFHSLSTCAGRGCTGDDFGSVNVEAYELTGELYCEDCSDEAIATWAEDLEETPDAQERIDRFVAYWLDHLELRTTGRDPKNNAYAFAAVPDWALRQLRDPVVADEAAQ